MTIKDYQYITTLDSGSTTYEYDLAKYFKVDTNQSIDKVREDVAKHIQVNSDYELPKTGVIKFNGNSWMFEKDLLDCTFEQWIRLETVLSEQDNVKNLHKLLAIYLRPMRKKGFFKNLIESFRLDRQDEISTELLDLPLEITNSLMVFFYQSVNMFMNNIKIQYLNQINLRKNSLTKNQSTKSGVTLDGI